MTSRSLYDIPDFIVHAPTFVSLAIPVTGASFELASRDSARTALRHSAAR